jgi:hypothetical protein
LLSSSQVTKLYECIDSHDAVTLCMHEEGIDIESQELFSQTYSESGNRDDSIA